MELSQDEISLIQRHRTLQCEPFLFFTYYVKMYAPNPMEVGRYFTYDGMVSRKSMLNCGNAFDELLQGLADHVFAHCKVRISPQSIVIQQIELIPSDTAESIEPV